MPQVGRAVIRVCVNSKLIVFHLFYNVSRMLVRNGIKHASLQITGYALDDLAPIFLRI